MAEQYNGDMRPDLYPNIAPESRFAYLADAILRKSGSEDPSRQGSLVASWPDNKNYHYVLRSFVSNVHTGFLVVPALNFILEHHIDELPEGQPLTRYSISVINTMTTSVIRLCEANGTTKPLIGETQNEVNQKALSILSEAQPDEATNFLREIFHNRFVQSAGSYVLSDLALTGEDEEINDTTVKHAIQDFDQQVQNIEEEALVWARHRRAKRYAQPAYTETVQEAIETRHYPTKSNKYRDVDTRLAALSFAMGLGNKWVNTVAPGQ